MTKRVSRDQVFFAFHPELTPVLEVEQGEEVVMETHDCFEGQLKTSAGSILTRPAVRYR